MAATTQEEILSGILPRVSIEKINLANSSNKLEVTVELNIKEVLDNNFFGSWFDDINIKKYIVIDVVQSTDPQVTEALSFSNDMILLCNLSRNLIKKGDMRTKALAYLTGKTQIKELLDLLQRRTKRNPISLLEDSSRNKEVKNYPSYVNSDGQKVYEISYKTKFTLDNIEPEHLAYFAVCSIDLQTLCADLKIDYDVAESFEENGKVISEIVIENSKIAGYSYVYVDENGVAWSGPVHQNDIGEWRSGDDETPDSITLSRITVSNTKIQDFRNFAEIERMIFDFNQQKRNERGDLITVGLENTLNQITRIQSVDYKVEKQIPQFTNLFSSIDSSGNIKFLFGAEFINILKSYSKFSKLYDSNNETFKLESIPNTKILDLKLYRRRIKNNVLSSNSNAEVVLEKLDANEPDELILQTSDISWKNFLNLNNNKASIRETSLYVDGDNEFMRYFTGIDKTFKNLTDGVYQYYIEFEIEDGVIQMAKEKLQRLSLAKNELVQYYNKVSKPTMRKFLIETQNPHIDSPRETSNNSMITDYGYDVVLNKLSPQLVSRLIREYGGVDSVTAPWIQPVAIFAEILDTFSESISTNDDRTALVDFLHIALNPNSTNPSCISKIIELIDYFMSSLCNTFDINIENLTDSTQTSPVSSRTSRSFKITKFFNEIFDSNFLKSYNIDYLSASPNEINNQDGLTLLNKSKLNQRISNEMLRFFNTENPNINFNSTSDNPENLKYSFLTPSRLDIKNTSVIFSGVDSGIVTNENREVYNFYDSALKYEKAISIYADILNFKLDVSGKNRDVPASRKNERITLPENEKGNDKQKETLYSSRKINDLFSNFANVTIENFSTINSENLSFKDNLKPLINLMSSLSSGAIRNRQSYGQAYTTNSTRPTNNIISNTENDYVKNLANKNINNIRITNIGGRSIVLGFDRGFLVSKLNRIPNQIRALIFKPQNELSNNIKNQLNYADNFSRYIENKTINYFNFEMIAEIEYLSGFERIENTEQISLNNPIWKTLDKQYLDGITQETEILCRLKSFENKDLGISISSDLEKRFYDKYFVIRTTDIQQIERPRFTLTNPLIGNFIESISNTFPGLRINQFKDNLPALSAIPSNIQITIANSTGNREIINIKDVRDMVSKDISRNANITVGKPITPAIAFSAVHALSLGKQETNIDNKYKSSNHISNRHIGSRKNNTIQRQRTRIISGI